MDDDTDRFIAPSFYFISSFPMLPIQPNHFFAAASALALETGYARHDGPFNEYLYSHKVYAPLHCKGSLIH